MKLGFDITFGQVGAPPPDYNFWGSYADVVEADADIASRGATPGVGDYVAVFEWQELTGYEPFILRWGDSSTSTGRTEEGWVLFRAFMLGTLPTGALTDSANVWEGGDPAVGAAEWVSLWLSPTPSTAAVAALYFWDGGQWSEAPFAENRAWAPVLLIGDLPTSAEFVKDGDTAVVEDPAYTSRLVRDTTWQHLHISDVADAGDLPDSDVREGAVALVGTGLTSESDVYLRIEGDEWVWVNEPAPPTPSDSRSIYAYTTFLEGVS